MPGALTIIQGADPFVGDTGSVWNWKFQILKADIFVWQHRYPDALLLVSPQPPKGLPIELLIRRELLQAASLAGLSRFDQAQECIHEAEALARQGYTDASVEVALAQGNLFRLLHMTSESENQFEMASALGRNGHNQRAEARALGNLALLYAGDGLYDKALDRGLEALQLSQSLGARHLEASVCLNVGLSYLDLGDFQQAVPMLKQSEALAAEMGMQSVQDMALNDLGGISMSQGNLKAAESFYDRALALAHGRDDQAAISNYLNNLSLVAIERGNLDEAEKYVQEALILQSKTHDPVRKLRCLLASALIALRRKQFDKAKEAVQGILQDRGVPESLHAEAEDLLGNIDRDDRQISQAQMDFRQALVELKKTRAFIHDDERRLAFSSLEANFYTDYISLLVDRGNKFGGLLLSEDMRAGTLEEALAEQKMTPLSEPILRSKKSTPISLSLLQSFLRAKNEVILAYWLNSNGSYLWVITPSQFELFPLPAKQDIEPEIERYQQRVSSLGNIEPTDAAGQELYQTLVAPAQKLIAAQAHVVIIPDGSLGKLNFETLIVPTPSPHFWIDDVETEDASSIGLLINSRPSQRRAGKLLAIGDPLEVTSDYPRLKYAQKEIEAVAAQFPANARTIVSGPDATPSAYASHRPREFDIIHFSTHGFASEIRPLESAIILSKQADGAFKLYARDIVNMHLKAEIVTISACYGAGKRTYSGEGLIGLAWAFLRAGAHQVVAGLWNVEDQPTPQLMRDFYAELTHGRSAAAALRDAKLKMVHSNTVYRLPYYWGSLQLYTGS